RWTMGTTPANRRRPQAAYERRLHPRKSRSLDLLLRALYRRRLGVHRVFSDSIRSRLGRDRRRQYRTSARARRLEYRRARIDTRRLVFQLEVRAAWWTALERAD